MMRSTAVAALGLGVVLALGPVAGAQTVEQEVKVEGAQGQQKGSCVGPLSLQTPSQKLIQEELRGKIPPLAPESGLFDVALAGGSYKVSAGSEDVTHPATEKQKFESWFAVFYSDAAGKNEVGRTAVTPDLGANDMTDAWKLADLTLSGPAVKVQYFHAPVPAGSTAESVRPACLNLTVVPLTGSCAGRDQLPTPGFKILRTGFTPNTAGPFAINLPKGTYNVTAGSRDVTHNTPDQEAQTGEQWTAVFRDANGNIIGNTANTPDLDDSKVVEFYALPSVTFAVAAKSVTYVHASENTDLKGRADSVEPLCLGLTGSVYPPPKDDDKPKDDPKKEDPREEPREEPRDKEKEKPKTPTPEVPVVTPAPFVPSPNPPAIPVETTPVTAAPVVTPAPAVQAAVVTTVPKVEVLGTVVAAPAAVQIVEAQPSTEVLGAVVERQVAFTGADSIPMAFAGLAFTGLGGVLLMGARRRKATGHRR